MTYGLNATVTDHYDPLPAQKLIARHKALTYPYVCTFGGAQLVIEEGAFCPTLTNASPLLLKAIDFKPNETVLDVFSGSGAFGVIAAVNGANVVTVDTSAAAVQCAVANAARNDVGGRMDIREGTMQTAIREEEKFDLVIANPPLLPGIPQDSLTAAIFDPGLGSTVDFIASLRGLLADGGRGYLIVSDVFKRYGHDLEKLCAENGLLNKPVATLDTGSELYTVYKLTKAKEAPAKLTAPRDQIAAQTK